jgi:hypothetical protein
VEAAICTGLFPSIALVTLRKSRLKAAQRIATKRGGRLSRSALREADAFLLKSQFDGALRPHPGSILGDGAWLQHRRARAGLLAGGASRRSWLSGWFCRLTLCV